MTTPIRMVSVPVKPTESMIAEGDAVMRGRYGCCFEVEPIWSAMLSAAPVREEGGAVRAWMFRESPSERWHVTMDRRSVDEYLKAFSTAEVHPLAIATREEAPVRECDDCGSPLNSDGECTRDLAEREADDRAEAVYREEALAAAGEVDEDWILGLIGEAVCMAEDQEREDESDEEICRIAESVLNAIRPYLRAQPPAREDAKVCYDCATDRPHRMTEACTHPAPDALRAAVEKLETAKITDDPAEVFMLAMEALVILQAEQEAK